MVVRYGPGAVGRTAGDVMATFHPVAGPAGATSPARHAQRHRLRRDRQRRADGAADPLPRGNAGWRRPERRHHRGDHHRRRDHPRRRRDAAIGMALGHDSRGTARRRDQRLHGRRLLDLLARRFRSAPRSSIAPTTTWRSRSRPAARRRSTAQNSLRRSRRSRDTAPPVDYLAKDFDSFRHALADFSSVRYPAWQERSESDFGVMFMEALAAVADDLSYQQDRVAAEAWLEAATQRRSLVRLARLVDYEPRVATAATTTLQFRMAASGSIPPGVVVGALAPDGSLVEFETGTGLGDEETYDAHPEWNEMVPHWFGDEQRCVPPGAAELYLVRPGVPLVRGQLLLVEEAPASPADPPRRAVVRLDADPGRRGRSALRAAARGHDADAHPVARRRRAAVRSRPGQDNGARQPRPGNPRAPPGRVALSPPATGHPSPVRPAPSYALAPAARRCSCTPCRSGR